MYVKQSKKIIWKFILNIMKVNTSSSSSDENDHRENNQCEMKNMVNKLKHPS